MRSRSRLPIAALAAGVALSTVLVLSGCVAGAPAAIGAHHYRSSALSGAGVVDAAIAAAPVRVWFEHANGALVMIAASPVTVPVTFSGSAIVPKVNEVAGTAVGCAGTSPGCTVDGWPSRFITQKLHYVTAGRTLAVSEGAVKLTLQRA